MDRHIIIFTADKRQEKLVSLMEGEKRDDAWDETSKEYETCEKIYVLPIPVTKLEQNAVLKEKLKQELIKQGSVAGVEIKVFGGALSQEWCDFLDSYKIPYWDFMKLPEVVDGNGKITAEASVAEVLQLSEYAINGQKILVTGYGCCGEKIAKLFGSMGAKVIVVARRKEVRQQAVSDGFCAVDFEEMKMELQDAFTVINTVPSMVLSEDCIQRMPPGAIIVDIASKPGGTDFEAAKKYGVPAKLALGLPGIYTTSSSALLLKNAIFQYAPLQENEKGDKLWIFQVFI